MQVAIEMWGYSDEYSPVWKIKTPEAIEKRLQMWTRLRIEG